MDKREQAHKVYNSIPLHLCFDVKHLCFDVEHDLRRKDCLVVRGHMIDPPYKDDYSCVVSINRICLNMFILIHNGICTAACDIVNAYLEAKTR